MEHHGPQTWLTQLPFLSHDHAYIPVNGAVLVFCAILIGAVIARIRIAGKIEALIVPPKNVSLVSMVDVLVEGLHGMVVGTLGHHGSRHFPFIATLFIFVWLSNLLGLLPLAESPSSNLNTTLALGAASFIYYNLMGVKEHGLVGYAKHFLMGLGIFGVPIALLEIFSHALRPVTLGVRLYLNLSIDHRLAGAFAELCKWIVPVPLLLFGVVICTIQAFLFATLTSVYIQMATEHEEHTEHHK